MKNYRMALGRLLSVILVLAICITTVFSCMMYVSAIDSEVTYDISGVNVVYEDNGTMSVNVHIPSAVEGERLVITKADGSASKHPDIEGMAVVPSTYAGTADLPVDAKMYTVSNLSATDLADTLIFTRVVGDASGTPQEFSFKAYAVDVITDADNVHYPDGTTSAQKTAHKELVAAFANYATYASKALNAQSNTQLDAAITTQLDNTLYDENGSELLSSWSKFVADNTQFKADEFTENDPNLTVHGTGLNLKGNPYLLITFALLDQYAEDKENVVATFTVGDQTISVKGNEMTNNTGAGRYHLVRLKGITVNNLCKDVDVSVTYNGEEVLYGTFGIGGFVNSAINAQMESYSLVGKSILYYCNVIDARNIIKKQPTPVAVYGESFDADANSLGMSLNFYNRVSGDIGSEITLADGTKQTVTKLYTDITAASNAPWGDCAAQIKQVRVVDSGIAPSNMNAWFKGFANCTSFDLAKLDTSNTATAAEMFNGCNSMTYLDLSSFKTTNLTNADNMFLNCSSLKTVIVSSNWQYNGADGETMFSGCLALIGGNGTAYTDTDTNGTYAVIDGLNGNNGYFTGIVQPNIQKNTMGVMWGFSSADSFTVGQDSAIKLNGDTLPEWVYLISNVQNTKPVVATVTNGEVVIPADMMVKNNSISVICEEDYTYAVLDKETSELSIRSRGAVVVNNTDGTPKQLVEKDGAIYTLGESGDVYALPTSNGDGTTTKGQPIAKGTTPDGANDGWTMVHNGYGGAVGAKAVSVTFDDTVYLQGDLRELFQGWPVLESVNLEKADFSDVTVVYKLFDNCKQLKNITFSQSVNLSKVDSLNTMFYLLPVLETLDLSGFDICNVTNMSSMITSCGLTSLDVSGWANENVTTMSSMFGSCTKLTNIDFTDFKTPSVTNMSSMFHTCNALKTLDLSSFNTSNVTDMNNMFNRCKALKTINFGDNFNTSKVTNMNSMFWDCNALNNLDFSGFDTSQVKDMGSMFNYCTSITELDLTSFNTSNVTNMSLMFNTCQVMTELKWDAAKFTTSNVTNMSGMFSSCKKLNVLDVSHFDTSNVTNMSSMFNSCHALTNLDLSSFDTSKVTSMDSMFKDYKNSTIYVSDRFVTDSLTSTGSVFTWAYSLAGGNGTSANAISKIDTDYHDAKYAVIDGVDDKPGYFRTHTVEVWHNAGDGVMHYGTCTAMHNGTDVCGATVYEVHTFENDKCTKCDQHEHKVSDWTSMTVYTHNGTCTVEGCGISVTEHHAFDENGICTLCSRKCTHSNPGWNSNNAEMHRKVCAYCKLTIQSGKHNFNSEGKCTVCSYQCKHTELSECTPNEDGVTHSATCIACKVVVNKEHTYTDGKCICGKEESNEQPTE